MDERDLIGEAVGDGVEAVTRAEGADARTLLHCLLDFCERVRRVEMVGVVTEVAGPVGLVGLRLLRVRRVGVGEAGKKRAGCKCGGGLQELPLVHFAIDPPGWPTGAPTECRDYEAAEARTGS